MSIPDFSKVKLVSKNWWKQYDFEFKGVSCQYVVFPRDRLMCFTRDKLNKKGERESVIVPPFNRLKSTPSSTVETLLGDCIRCFEEDLGPLPKDAHLYLCGVEGVPVQDFLGMMVMIGTATPATDHYFDQIKEVEDSKRMAKAIDRVITKFILPHSHENKDSVPPIVRPSTTPPFDHIPGLAQKW